MGLVADLFESRVSPANPDAWYIRLFAGHETDAGVAVTQESALSSTAIFAGIRLLAEAMATVPLNVYRADGSRREVARDHPLHEVLHNRWNPELTAAEGRSILIANMVACGNGYCEIVRDRAGRVRELWPIWPHRIMPERDGSRLLYRFQSVNGTPRLLPPDRILHVRGFSMGGLVGEDVILKMREAVGLTLGTERFGAKFFGQGMNPGGVLEHPQTLSNEAQKRLLDSWSGGLDSAHRVKVLEEGMTFKPISVPPEAAQFLETRKFQISEVARMLNVPPHMLREMDRATFSNIEHQGIEFVRYSLRPLAVLMEQRLNGLLTQRERADGYYTKHVMEGLLRGDLQARSEAYAIGRNWGWLSANDVRELEDMNPIEDGDMYLVPGNMMPTDMAGQLMAPQPSPETDDDPDPPRRAEKRDRMEPILELRDRYRGAQKRTLEQVAAGVVAREVREVRAQLNKQFRDANEFRDWLNRFYREFNSFVTEVFLPALLTYAELMQASAEQELDVRDLDVQEFVQEYANTLGVRWAGQARREITRAMRDVPPQEMEAAVRSVLDRWERQKAPAVANHEATRAGSAFLRAAYLAGGVQFVRWVTRGDNCPLCSKMNGRVVDIQRSFLSPGDVVDPEDPNTEPLEVTKQISHPPLHRGCDCGLTAEVQ